MDRSQHAYCTSLIYMQRAVSTFNCLLLAFFLIYQSGRSRSQYILSLP